MSMEDDVRWLMDRAAISDLLFSFAHSLDSGDIDTYVTKYLPDGVLQFRFHGGKTVDVVGQEAIRKTVSAQFNPDGVIASHHLSANHQIQIDGDRAHSRSYFQATHILND